jgi:hypothetical protein
MAIGFHDAYFAAERQQPDARLDKAEAAYDEAIRRWRAAEA